MSDIKNLLFISDRLTCAGQPDEAQLAEIAAQGFEVVINLGLTGTKYALPDEGAAVGRLGLEYHHIPVLFDKPQFSDLESFLAIMKQKQTRKTFVHCAVNYRATAFTGLYLFAIAEIDQSQLQSFINQVWHPDHVWQQFIDDATRRLKPQ